MLLNEVAAEKKELNKQKAISLRDDIAKYVSDNKDDKAYVRRRYVKDSPSVSFTVAYPRSDITAGMSGEEYIVYKRMQFYDMADFLDDCIEYISNVHKYNLKKVDDGDNVHMCDVFKDGPIEIHRYYKRPGFEVYISYKE